MNLSVQEVDKIRLHVGIRSGFRRIEKDKEAGLVGSRSWEGPLEPLPRLEPEIRAAGRVLEYLAGPLLHDLNRMTIMLETWEEKLHPVPQKEIRRLISGMETWITAHGGRP